MADTSRIHSLVAAARRRLKLQSALEAAVLAVIPAAAAVAAVVFLVRSETLGETAGLALIAGCGAVVLLGGLLGWMRRIPGAYVATRVDRASGLSDRLATAISFEEELRRGVEIPDETRAFMEAAIDDAVRAAPRADVKAATPFAWPRDTRAAAAFLAAAAVVSLLYLPPVERDPSIALCEPAAAARSAEIEVRGARFTEAGALWVGAAPAVIIEWTPQKIRARVPDKAAVGPTELVVEAGGRRSRPYRFEVLKDGERLRDRNEPLAMAEDDMDYTRDLLEELRRTAEANQDPELTQLTEQIEKLLDDAEMGKLSREELLDKLQAAHDEYMKGGNQKMLEETIADLKKSGKELEKSELTKELGKALSQGDMDAAKQEMEKLAEKLAKGEVSEKQAQEAARAMEKAAKEMEKRQGERESAADKRVAQAEKDVAKAEEKVAKAKNESEKKEAERRLQDKQKQLEQAQKEQKDQKTAEEKRTLKRLQRNMKQASQQMQDRNQENRRMASRTMEDMARDTGKVDSDQRKMTNQKKVASQLDDLKEAMRRAKRGGTRGPEDRFGRNKRNADFQRRARGGKGSKQAWRPGQGQKGQGQGNQPGGKGNQPGGSSYGDEHDPDMLGDATKKQGNTVDESVSGTHGKGPSIKETIVSSAQKGFASKAYKDVYGRYKPAIEEVINSEKVPSGYKYYVKKYFQKIKPHAMD
ncbi:MAG TPA: hypothetical protein VFU21_05005 [Kofleriaceae bacterium]|nr:hypothetical protein [Kofleriaceae bacterium]